MQTTSTLVAATQLGVFHVVGEDALTFLQGQSTPDLRRLDRGQSVFGGFCNAQGRVIANGWFQRIGDGFRLVISQDLIPALQKRLRMYVLRSRVVITEGDGSPLWLVRQDLPEIQHDWGIEGPMGVHVIRLAENQRAQDTSTLFGESFNLTLIQAGIPLVSLETSERYIPHMLSMDRLGSLSFEKGCYTGQEIVTRTQFLGKVKRTLHRVASDDTLQLTAGTPVMSHSSEEPIGELFRWAPLPGGGSVGLAIIKEEAATEAAIVMDRHWVTLSPAFGA